MHGTVESKKRETLFALFLVALLCFTLPFIKFQAKRGAISLSGIQLITGIEVEQTAFDGKTEKSKEGRSPLVIALFICILLALVSCFLPRYFGKFVPITFGLFGLILVFIMRVSDDYHRALLESQGLSGHYQIGFFLTWSFLALGIITAGLQSYQDLAPRFRIRFIASLGVVGLIVSASLWFLSRYLPSILPVPSQSQATAESTHGIEGKSLGSGGTQRARSQLDPYFLGVWEGEGLQNGSTRVRLRMVLEPQSYLMAHRGLFWQCTGNLIPLTYADGHAEFREEITRGACYNNGKVVLSRMADGRTHWTWSSDRRRTRVEGVLNKLE